jgi:hypothetical protein
MAQGDFVTVLIRKNVVSYQELGRTVPQRDHHVRVRAQRGAVLSRESKVADLEIALIVVQYIGCLQVSATERAGIRAVRLSM